MEIETLPLGVIVALLLGVTVVFLVRERSLRRVAEGDFRIAKEHLDSTNRRLSQVTLTVHREDRYSIEIEDWGPDFTGLDGTLPRYRWVVWDADREVKQALREYHAAEVGITMPYMLGNAPSRAQALMQALAFVEQRQHPAMVLHVDETTPGPTVVLSDG